MSVTREPHPTDRRTTLVRLTDRGRSFTTTLRDERIAMAAALFDDLPSAQVQAFLDITSSALAKLTSTEAETQLGW